MPYADPEKQKAFQRAWRRARRDAWLKAHGPCAKCGSWRMLQVDHVDPKKKVHHNVWSWSLRRRTKELAKCQPLCKRCHRKKTLAEVPPTAHGRGQMYQRYGCRCVRCRAWKRDSDAKYRSPEWRATRV